MVAALVGGVVAAAGNDSGDDTATEGAESDASGSDEPTADRATTTAAPTTTTTVPPDPPTLPMGQPLPFTISGFSNGEIDVEVVVANPITADREPGEFGLEPSRGLFLVVDVSVRALSGDGSYSASPYEFKFVAADGTVAQSTYVGGFGAELPYSDLSAGQQIAGKVGFDIAPRQEVGGRIQLSDVGENYGEPFAYWAL